jgi:hypothetical protein
MKKKGLGREGKAMRVVCGRRIEVGFLCGGYEVKIRFKVGVGNGMISPT